MFGYNWRKISKFITSKTANQVKVYYNQWSKTANIIHESDNSISDSSINNSQNKENGYLSLNDTTVISYKNIVGSSNMKSEEGSCDIDMNESGSNNDNCENELVVSSLNDWDLGSQVSVVEEVLSDDSGKELQINEEVCFNKKKGKCRIKRKINSNLRKQDLTLQTKNIIGMSKPRVHMNEGQIVHLTKVSNDNEDSDIDIDGTDDNDSSFNFSSTEIDYQHVKPSQINLLKGFSLLTEDEKVLCSSLWPLNTDLGFIKFVDIKTDIINCWNQNKYSVLSLTKVMTSLQHTKESKKTISKIFDVLEKKQLINFDMKSDDIKTFTNKPSKRRKIATKNIGKNFKGGITMSHDASGAVVDALHIVDSSTNGIFPKKKQHIKLKNYVKHDKNVPAPYTPIIHPLAFVTLDMHAHSSYSEVMGLLGGFLDPCSDTLYVNMAVPTKSTSSGVACDMCPMAQIAAAEMIHNEDFEVVGWYHSHPTFLPNPSDRDLHTQSQMQNLFNRNAAPFIGVIISPFYFTAGSDSSLMRCMILDKVGYNHGTGNVPFRLPWSINENIEVLNENIEDQLRKSVQSLCVHNSLHWQSEYKDGRTFADKLESSLQFHLPKKLQPIVSKSKKIMLNS